MNTSNFQSFSLNASILRALSDEGYEEPTPIQRAAIPMALAGRDLLATAQTGTGKTAAFALPILHRLHERNHRQRAIRVLILAPTRELALQIEESFICYGRYLTLKVAAVLGGVSSVPQIKALQKKPDILVATPGRLLDLFGQGYIRFDDIETFVLDEADRMLDMGFIPDIRKIIAQLPSERQTMLFSATIAPEIADLAAGMLTNPERVAVAPPAAVADNIEQKVLFVEQGKKHHLITGLLKEQNIGRALVFARTKRRADRLSRQLSEEGIPSDAIHSNKTQGARQRALAAFDRGKIRVLVGTDIIARGIDVEGISHVINYDLPNDPESYVHRIGRTARAGAEGVALSLCYPDEVDMLRSIEKLTRNTIVPLENHPFHSHEAAVRREEAMLAHKNASTVVRIEHHPAKPGDYGRRPAKRRSR